MVAALSLVLASDHAFPIVIVWRLCYIYASKKGFEAQSISEAVG